MPFECAISTTGCSSLMSEIKSQFPLDEKYLEPVISETVWNTVDFNKLTYTSKVLNSKCSFESDAPEGGPERNRKYHTKDIGKYAKYWGMINADGNPTGYGLKEMTETTVSQNSGNSFSSTEIYHGLFVDGQFV